MSFDNENFISNPNFHFKEYPSDLRECLGCTYVFDVYKNKEGKAILITAYWNIDKQCNMDGDPSKDLEKYHYISLIDLENNKEITQLEAHKDRIITTRFFEDPHNGKQYLISADRKYQVIVWDLTDNGKIIFNENVKYDNFIYSVYMIFEKAKIYIITSTLGVGETCIYSMGGDNKNPKKLKDTKDLNIYYLDYWFGEKDDQRDGEDHHIIQCGKSAILISQLNHDTNYIIETGELYACNLAGMVFQKGNENLFISSSSRGLIQVIDLVQGKQIKNFHFSDVFFYNFIKWNEQYFLLYEALQRRIYVIDIDDEYKVVSKVLCPEMFYDRFIKKVKHPLYGEGFLSAGTDWKIKLYVSRNIIRDNK